MFDVSINVTTQKQTILHLLKKDPHHCKDSMIWINQHVNGDIAKQNCLLQFLLFHHPYRQQ